jgi:hypothetical protein
VRFPIGLGPVIRSSHPSHDPAKPFCRPVETP